MKIQPIILVLFLLVGCTDASWKQYSTFGLPAHVTCYSGGKITYQGTSTGKVHSEKSSDGWFFEDAISHKLIRVSGACVIEN